MQNKRKVKNLGTKEWASSNINLFQGCEHNCRYCYAKKMAIRFNRKTEENWKVMELNEKAYEKGYSKRNGVIMFPTAHDITPSTVDAYMEVLAKLVMSDENKVLIVSKPHLECIGKICTWFQYNRDYIEFRFTIGTNDNRVLKFWEPNAPDYEERLECVKFASQNGFVVSISMEPLLILDPQKIIDDVKDYVKEIWIGKMNNYCLTKPKYFLLNEDEFCCEQQKINSDWNFKKLKEKYGSYPEIKFKNNS